jgi:nucleotide-binding universal stress UspA family protein
VTPALFLAGFSLRSASVQRVVAILELLRAVAAFMIAPILVHFATTLTGYPTPAMSTALWVCFGLSPGGAVAFACLYVLGGVRPRAPAVERWKDGQEPAWDSPALLAAVRHAPTGPVTGQLPARATSGADRRGQPAASLSPAPPAGRERRDRAGPVLLAYDGSDLAKAAIAEAGDQLTARREALVVTVWRTFNVGFVPEPGAQLDAACGDEVRQAAEQTAAHGAALAEAAGFRAHAVAVEGTPAWKGIVHAAEGHAASLIVLGSHRRAGLGGLVAGSVSGDVASRSRWPVLIVHDHDGADAHPTNALFSASSPEDALPDRHLAMLGT